MGAYYYDQSIPLRILLTPISEPIEIPPEGGAFNYIYILHLTNTAPTTLNIEVWCDVTLPNGTIYEPVLGPVSVNLVSGLTVSRERTQVIPAGAPVGTYSYNAYATWGLITSTDSFAFVKLESGDWDGLSGWFNEGEPFDETASLRDEGAIPEIYSLEQNYPNPFNPTTIIRFALPTASWVKLEVFDISGRNVGARHASPLLDRWMEAGRYQVTFDASDLASGIYLAHLKVGDFSQVQKMVLVE